MWWSEADGWSQDITKSCWNVPFVQNKIASGKEQIIEKSLMFYVHQLAVVTSWETTKGEGNVGDEWWWLINKEKPSFSLFVAEFSERVDKSRVLHDKEALTLIIARRFDMSLQGTIQRNKEEKAGGGNCLWNCRRTSSFNHLVESSS